MKIRTAYQRRAHAATSLGSKCAQATLPRWRKAVGEDLFPSRSLANPMGCLRSEVTAAGDDGRWRPRMS